MTKVVLFVFCCLIGSFTSAQPLYFPRRPLTGCVPPASKFIGLEMQAYTAGQIYFLRYDYGHYGGFNFRVGYNRAFRKNFSGINDDEHGGGLGFSPGINIPALSNYQDNFSIGVRCDVWWLAIYWKDNNHTPMQGKTRITVLQPVAELNYNLWFGYKWKMVVSLAFGREINIITKGKPVGQGGISLAGISISRSIF